MKKKNLKRRLALLTISLSVSLCAISMPAIAVWKHIGYLGDINNDTEVNIADLLLLSKYILNNVTLTSENAYHIDGQEYSINGNNSAGSTEYLQTADVNQDGKIDTFDLTSLRKYLLSHNFQSVYVWSDDETPSQTTTTTSTTETSTTTTSFIEAPVKDLYGSMPSQGNAEMIIFYVDFPDCPYSYEPSVSEIETISFGEEDAENKNYPYESMSAFYSRSSKGCMELNGKVFRYTTKENKSAYENDIYHIKLIDEICQEFKDNIDFAQFDGNNDNIIDTMLISVPADAGDDNWWPAAGQYGGTNINVNGMSIGHVIVGNAQIESKNNYKNFIGSYLHEMGHCMGLPDYYLYNGEKDFEGLHGSGGYEMMDETNADFSSVSKLMLGWFTNDQISVYDYNTSPQTFTLYNAQKENGNCVIIPYGKLKNNYYSEFFILEYTTLDANNSYIKKDYWWETTGSGLRILHVEGTINDNSYWKYWKYASGDNEATKNDTGRRFVRIIDDSDTDNLYHAGDIINSTISGFQWYDENDTQSVDTGLEITVISMTDDMCTITISEK